MGTSLEGAKARAVPPFRGDHVGSFLRPESVKIARQAFQDGKLDKAGLRNVEDEAIRHIVEKQIACGLKGITDGELRRSWWHLDFFDGLEGVEKISVGHGFAFHGVQTRPETVVLRDKVRFGRHYMLDDFAFLQSLVGGGTHLAKLSIPSPAMLHFVLAVRADNFKLPPFYASEDELERDIVHAYRDAIQAFHKLGCRYLQLDDTSWGGLCSPDQRDKFKSKGIDPDKLAERYVRMINQTVDGRPSDMAVTMHICRGNFRSTWMGSGGYDPVAPILFPHCRIDGFFLEYDTDRSGDFKPLKHIQNQQVVLGLITSKTGEMEDRDAIKARIAEAAAYVPINQLCLSPQCGFSSTEEGNTLTEDAQWAKIRLVTSIAAEVWK